MKRLVFFSLLILTLIACSRNTLVPTVGSAGGTRLIVNLRVNPPSAALRIADAATVKFLKDNGAVIVRVELLSQSDNRTVRRQDFDVAAGEGVLENVPVGTFTLRVQALDNLSNVIFIDTSTVTIKPAPVNSASAALDPIPAIPTATAKGRLVEVEGKRFTDEATAAIDGKPVPIVSRTATRLRVDLSDIGPGQHTLTITNRPGKKETEKVITFRSGIQIEPAVASVNAGVTISLLALGAGEVNWSSADTGKATVSPSGLVSGISEGTVTITATAKDDPGLTATATITVLPVNTVPVVSAVSVIAPTTVLEVGKTLALTGTVTMSDGTRNQNLNWGATRAGVATVDQNGIVTGRGRGTVTITATSTQDPSQSKSVEIQVVDPPPVVVPEPLPTTSTPPSEPSITLTPQTGIVSVGKAIALTATAFTADGTSSDIDWSSSDSSIATVSAQGFVTGVAPGTAIITATAQLDRTLSASAGITVVNDVVVSSVTVSATSTTVNVNGNLTLTGTVTMSDGSKNANVSWASSNTAMATVDQNGVVTGISAGPVTITATSIQDNSRSGSINLQVSSPSPPPPVTVISVTPSPSSASIQVGAQVLLTATVQLSDGNSETSVIWSSSNTGVATVNTSGVVTAVAPGTVTITAASTRNTSKSGTATVTVTPAPLVLFPNSLTFLAAGDSQAFTATQSGYSGTFTASTSNANVATVSPASGTGNFTVTSVAAGTATITITGQGGATANVSVSITTGAINIQ